MTNIKLALEKRIEPQVCIWHKNLLKHWDIKNMQLKDKNSLRA